MSSFTYKVIGSKLSGNGKKLYDILDLNTNKVVQHFGSFIREKGQDKFINAIVYENGKKFNILKTDKVEV